jgi:hypothetical protein
MATLGPLERLQKLAVKGEMPHLAQDISALFTKALNMYFEGKRVTLVPIA